MSLVKKKEKKRKIESTPSKEALSAIHSRLCHMLDWPTQMIGQEFEIGFEPVCGLLSKTGSVERLKRRRNI